MPLRDDASIEITAFGWVPERAQGLVRDLRVRWALEEAGLDYRVRLLGRPRPEEYLKEQPFDQVPTFRDEDVHIFETGAIVQYVGETSEVLLPRESNARWRAIQWTYAALNSVEPGLQYLALIDLFYTNEEWAKLRRPGAEEFTLNKLRRISDWLGEKEWLEDRFTVGDLMMVTVLRLLRHTDLVERYPNVQAYLSRGQARPAFRKALADHLSPFSINQPQGEAA